MRKEPPKSATEEIPLYVAYQSECADHGLHERHWVSVHAPFGNNLYGRESGDRILRNSDSGMGLYAYGFGTTSQFSITDIFSPVIPVEKSTTAPNRRFWSG